MEFFSRSHLDLMVTAREEAQAGRVTDEDTGERYYIHPVSGNLLDSVTTVISATSYKPWIPRWHATSSLGWAADNIGLFVQALVTDGRKAAVDLGKDAAERIRDIKRDCGVYVHDVQQALIWWAASPGREGAMIALPVLPEHLDGVLYDGEPIQDVADAMVDGFVSFVSQWNPVFEATEMPVYNEDAGVAGTLDAVVRLDGYALSIGTGHKGADELVPRPGSAIRACVDTKTGRNHEGTWRDQLAAYRRMTECRPSLLDDVRLMPRTDCGMVLHLRKEHPAGFLLHLVSAQDDEPAWQRFLKRTSIYREQQDLKGKPGPSVRPAGPDGSVPGLRVCDLAGEGWGRALAPLAAALGSDAELEQVARFSQKELLAVKGIGPKLAADIRVMLADYGIIGMEG